MELNVKSKLITAIFALLLTLILFTNANNPTQKQQKPTYNYEETIKEVPIVFEYNDKKYYIQGYEPNVDVNRIKETQTISEEPVVIQKEQEVTRQSINSVSTYQPNRLARTEIIPDHIAHPEKYQANDSQEQLRKAELSLKSIITGLTPDEMKELKYLEQLETQSA